MTSMALDLLSLLMIGSFLVAALPRSRACDAVVHVVLVALAIGMPAVPKWAAALMAFGFGWTASRDLLEWSRR